MKLQNVLPIAIAALAAVPAALSESPFACNISALTKEARKRHFEVLSPKLAALKRSMRELPEGYEFEFASDTATFKLLAEWVDSERACCPFFEIEIRLERERGPLWLRLTGREGVKQFIRAEFERWFAKKDQ